MLRCRAVLVCDDVRQEVGNKFSAIGMYNDIIGFPAGQGPMGLPKLAFLFVLTGLAGVEEFRFRYSVSFNPSPTTPPVVPLQVMRRPQPELSEHTFMFQDDPGGLSRAGNSSGDARRRGRGRATSAV